MRRIVSLLVVIGGLRLAQAQGVTRVVAEHGGPMPTVTEPAVLFVRGYTSCPTIDAGVPDAAVPADAGVPDAGVGCLPAYTVTMVIQPSFVPASGGGKFALLTVTPAPPTVELESPTLFAELDAATAPFIDNEVVQVPDSSLGTVCNEGGGGCGGGGYYSSGNPTPPAPVLFDAQPAPNDAGTNATIIGPYAIANAQPTTIGDLSTWLDGLGFAYQQADLDAIAPYLTLGWNVVAIEVLPSVDTTVYALQPVALTWNGTEMRLPLGMAQQALSVPSQLTAYVLADDRYDMPGAHVSFAGYSQRSEPSFITRSEVTFDRTQPASADPIARLVPGEPFTQDTIVNTQYESVPVQQCDYRDDDDSIGCCNAAHARSSSAASFALYGLALVIVLRRRR
ncbi:MAG TPA: DUF2330 domain-containing protein [Kofleriaceae bacterium]|nr:DUF2330 domain-containing protein [Kofleriaceae bacterium]